MCYLSMLCSHNCSQSGDGTWEERNSSWVVYNCLCVFDEHFSVSMQSSFLCILLMKFLSDSHKFPNSSARTDQRQKGKIRLYILSIFLEEGGEMKE